MSLSALQIDEIAAELQERDHRSYAQIADAYGVTKNAVIGAMARRGVKSPKAPKVRSAALSDAEIRAALRKHGSAEKAAPALGMAASTLRSACIKRRIDVGAFSSRAAIRRTSATGRSVASSRFYAAPVRPVKAPDWVADEMRRLADEAIAAGRITVLKPGYAMHSTNMQWERIL